MDLPTALPHSTHGDPGGAMTADLVTITAALAREILATEHWHGARSLVPEHLAALLAALRSGELRHFVLMRCELPDGRRRLIDGQHCLAAHAAFDGETPAVIITYRVADERAVRDKYLRLAHGLKRNAKARLVTPSDIRRVAVKRPSRRAGG